MNVCNVYQIHGKEKITRKQKRKTNTQKLLLFLHSSLLLGIFFFLSFFLLFFALRFFLTEWNWFLWCVYILMCVICSIDEINGHNHRAMDMFSTQSFYCWPVALVGWVLGSHSFFFIRCFFSHLKFVSKYIWHLAWRGSLAHAMRTVNTHLSSYLFVFYISWFDTTLTRSLSLFHSPIHLHSLTSISNGYYYP